MHTIYNFKILLMDIVSRLKKYMTTIGMSSSQFADACYIPRPSFSQLLNGRNKKISDELITKIHETFPDLSILWLMFGEGDMVVNSNNEISEPQNRIKSPLDFFQSPNNQQSNISLNDNYNSTTFSSENFIQDADTKNEETAKNSIPQSLPNSLGDQLKNGLPLKLNTSANKRITNIVVFYDDNSFESFSPTN